MEKTDKEGEKQTVGVELKISPGQLMVNGELNIVFYSGLRLLLSYSASFGLL